MAVFCHEGTIRCVLEICEGEWVTPPLNNGGVYLFEYTDGNWKFEGQVEEVESDGNGDQTDYGK